MTQWGKQWDYKISENGAIAPAYDPMGSKMGYTFSDNGSIVPAITTGKF